MMKLKTKTVRYFMAKIECTNLYGKQLRIMT